MKSRCTRSSGTFECVIVHAGCVWACSFSSMHPTETCFLDSDLTCAHYFQYDWNRMTNQTKHMIYFKLPVSHMYTYAMLCLQGAFEIPVCGSTRVEDRTMST